MKRQKVNMCTGHDGNCDCDGSCFSDLGAARLIAFIGFSAMVFVLLALIAIAQTAFALEAPASLEAAKASVDERLAYSSYRSTYAAEEARPLGSTGNCTRFVLEYEKAVKAAGHTKTLRLACKVYIPTTSCYMGGKACTTFYMPVEHAFLLVDGFWVLDNRMEGVVPIDGNGCE